MEELTIEELAPYLAHNLKCQYFGIVDVLQYNKSLFGDQFDSKEETGMGLKIGELKKIKIYKKSWSAHIGKFHGHLKSYVRGNGCYPIMYPLSALTEPVLEGGKIPIVELANLVIVAIKTTIKFNVDPDLFEFGCTADDNHFWYNKGGSFGFSIIDKREHFMMIRNQLQLFHQLYKWHFWLGDQSYFEKGLLIDKRTVK